MKLRKVQCQRHAASCVVNELCATRHAARGTGRRAPSRPAAPRRDTMILIKWPDVFSRDDVPCLVCITDHWIKVIRKVYCSLAQMQTISNCCGFFFSNCIASCNSSHVTHIIANSLIDIPCQRDLTCNNCNFDQKKCSFINGSGWRVLKHTWIVYTTLHCVDKSPLPFIRSLLMRFYFHICHDITHCALHVLSFL